MIIKYYRCPYCKSSAMEVGGKMNEPWKYSCTKCNAYILDCLINKDKDICEVYDTVAHKTTKYKET